MIAANGVTPIPVAIHTPTSYLQISYIRKIDFLCKRYRTRRNSPVSPAGIFIQYGWEKGRRDWGEKTKCGGGGGEGIEGGKSRAGRAVLSIFGWVISKLKDGGWIKSLSFCACVFSFSNQIKKWSKCCQGHLRKAWKKSPSYHTWTSVRTINSNPVMKKNTH